MNNLRTLIVVPSLPPRLEPLRQLAYNLWWSWNPPAVMLFRRLDVNSWDRLDHNPVALLWQLPQKRLEQVAADDAYVAQLGRVRDSLELYLTGRTWFDEQFSDHKQDLMAYFSAEFGVHESMPIYSGGLGVLAGDHLKAASDLGVPLVGIGLMYRQGYFRQQLAEDGWQLESYPAYDFHQWPATVVTNAEGKALRVSVQLGTETLAAQIWVVNVGRVRLFLLDADIPENSPSLRAVTSRLYGGDREMRIRQEILLGIGGLRALRAMGIQPTVYHMNEGHAAFLALERTRQTMRDESLSYHQAREVVTGGSIFTTHTPVPAGLDKFESRLVEQHLGWMAGELGVSSQELLNLGREAPNDEQAPFCMPILALRTAYRSNGVSKLHGEVARKMWQDSWPGVPREEIPIIHITNGIHTRTWINRSMAELFDQYLGPAWAEDPSDPEPWTRVDEIPDAELWAVHTRRRERLIVAARQRLREQLKRRGAPPADVEAADKVLDSDALTIGFARRFAPYKRATLLFRSLDRLAALINNTERPVQFIFAGKAHPNDGAGKELLRQIVAACNDPRLRRHVVFLEDHDMNLARVLVQGVDVWLNTPLRLHEASGTSGMKVIPNGGLNLSCLDGWWPEAHNGQNGWAIGDGRVYEDLAYQDHIEAGSLYNLLEREIVPLFYDRGEDGVPRKWIGRVKAALKTLCPYFSTNRMVKEYAEKMYIPAARRARRLCEKHFAVARALADWKRRLREQWHQVRVAEVRCDTPEVVKVGDRLALRARIHLGSISPDDVAVEIYCGAVDPSGEVTGGRKVPMTHVAGAGDGEHVFEGTLVCEASGRHGYAVRVVPNHEDLADRYDQGLLVWG